MKLAIDASRNRSGGAIVHIVNILHHFDPKNYDIKEIHLWSYDELLNKVPDYPWLVKHSPEVLNKSIVKQLRWQSKELPKEIRKAGCIALFSLDAGSVCRFSPYITMSRDMLSFEKKEIGRYFFSPAWLRLYLLKWVQLSSFKKSDATIFLTNYAKNTIAKYHKIDYETVIINHGISDRFRIHKQYEPNLIEKDEVVVSYVSNADLYKHNWKVVEAVSEIRKKFRINVKLRLLGAKGGHPKALLKIKEAIQKYDPQEEFVTQTPRISHPELIDHLKTTDIFLFASTCENMPNTLIEGMSTGLPVVSSNYGPMPEVVEDGAIFFDPENVESISTALHQMITDDELRKNHAKKSYELSTNFSWEKCSRKTFEFINNKIVNEYQ